MEDTNADLQKLQSLQRIRKFVVYGAIALIALSLVKREPMFIYGRVVLWASAGVLSLLEASALKKLNTKPGHRVHERGDLLRGLAAPAARLSLSARHGARLQNPNEVWPFFAARSGLVNVSAWSHWAISSEREAVALRHVLEERGDGLGVHAAARAAHAEA